MNEYETLKPLTEAQEKKCDKVIALLIELKKSGVHPIIIDGGGGAGIDFIRCSKSDLVSIGEEILDSGGQRSELDEYIYTPTKSWEVNVDYLVP